LIAAAAVTAASQGYAALEASAASRYEARVADRNAKLESEAAFTATENTRTEALAHYRKLAQLKGEQRVAQAANGVSLDFGSAMIAQDDTDLMGREDVQRIYDQGEQAVRGFDINSANYRDQGKAARKAATGALVKGGFEIAKTALSAATQYQGLRGKITPAAKRTNFAGTSSSGFSAGRTTFGRMPR
jgi:hypothetical protein